MKNLKLLALLTAMIFFVSCGSDDDGANPAGASPGTMSATITGTVNASFSASGALAGQPLVTATATSGVLAIVGNDGGSPTTSQININIGSYDGPGTYEFGITTGNSATYARTTVNLANPLNSEFLTFASLSGSVEITESGDSFTGTFSFSGSGSDETSVEVTNGQFNASPAASAGQ